MSAVETLSNRLLRTKSVCHLLDGCSVMTLWRHRQDPDFPAPVYLTEGGPPHWYEDDLRAWAKRRAEKVAKALAEKVREKETADAA